MDEEVFAVKCMHALSKVLLLFTFVPNDVLYRYKYIGICAECDWTKRCVHTNHR